MKKYCLLCFLAALTACLITGLYFEAVLAAPAAPVEHTLLQPDGSNFIALQWGDEWSNGFETMDGYTIMQDESGWWVYADLVEGQLKAYSLAGKTVPAGSDAPSELSTHLRRKSEKPAHPGMPSIEYQNNGSQPVLVLLASFSDRTGTYSAAQFATQVFGASASVKDFYDKGSYSNLNLYPVTETHGTANDGVVGWLPLGYPHPNTGNTFTTANQWIVYNALTQADGFVNFAAYDANTDGYISSSELHILVVVAGFEASYSGNTPSDWAHHWDLNSVGFPYLDGVRLGDWYHNGGYSQVGEIHQNHIATIGVMAHELGHDLSWPDLYDTDYTSHGTGDWSIMATGVWNATGSNPIGSSPALPDAWLKWYQGWLTPTVISGTQTGVSIPQSETNATAFLLAPNPGGVDWEWYQYSGTGEYFLVENRQLTGYDAGLPGCGLHILHIDESVSNTNPNSNENHPLVKFMEADGLDEIKLGTDPGDAGDPFPGSTINRTFNYSSTPNSRLYNGVDSLVSVTNIGNCMANMTADLAYTGQTNQAPVANAGVDQVVFTNLLVTLDGSASNDPDGNYPLTFLWSQVGGLPVTLINPGTVSPTFVAPNLAAILSFQLIVTDSLGASSSPDYVNVTVINSPPVANAGPDQTVNTLALVTLDGSASYDPDGNLPLFFQWFQTSGPGVALSNPQAVQPTFPAPPTACVLTFDLYVFDSVGGASAPDSVTITVQNQAPVANAGPDQTVVVNSLVSLDGTASYDPDGHLPLTYLWTQTAGPVVVLDNPAACSPTFLSPSGVSTLTFSLVVTDSLMQASVPDTVNIFVTGYKVYIPIAIK